MFTGEVFSIVLWAATTTPRQLEDFSHQRRRHAPPHGASGMGLAEILNRILQQLIACAVGRPPRR